MNKKVIKGRVARKTVAHKAKAKNKGLHNKGVNSRVYSHKSNHAANSVNKLHSKHKTRKHVTNIKHLTNNIVHHYSKKFCPKCGSPILYDESFCKKCRHIDFEFRDIKILLCNNCHSYNLKNKWQRFSDLNMVIKGVVDECVRHKAKYIDLGDEKISEISSYKAGVNKDFTVTVGIGKERYDLPATFSITLCHKCSKQGTKYFEGILQVRNADKSIIDFIKKDLSRYKSKGIHINKEIDIDGSGINVDYYYTDKGYLKVIAEKLRNNFGAILKHNAQLFSIDWETSKNLYRLNVLVEFPKYHKNDVIKIGRQLFKIVSMDEKIHVSNIETDTKTLLVHKESYDILKPVEVMLIKKYPEYEVLDPNTYYQARLMNPNDTLQINQKIRVVVDGGEAWMI
ncbi:MAG: NMD3-related protein [Candidatus Woesearchaeota archaeon]